MRIAIYGGTFDPIHIGHLSLAKSLVEQQIVDEVWVMISPQNPHKQNNAADYNDRLAMARIAAKNIPHIIISDFERLLPRPSYTITTLTELSYKYPEHQFSLVIGADNWQNFHKWYRVNDIIKHYPILIYRRPNYEKKLITIPKDSSIKIVDTPLFDVSSTEIRNQKKLDMINPDVMEYIRAHKLYFTAK